MRRSVLYLCSSVLWASPEISECLFPLHSFPVGVHGTVLLFLTRLNGWKSRLQRDSAVFLLFLLHCLCFQNQGLYLFRPGHCAMRLCTVHCTVHSSGTVSCTVALCSCLWLQQAGKLCSLLCSSVLFFRLLFIFFSVASHKENDPFPEISLEELRSFHSCILWCFKLCG